MGSSASETTTATDLDDLESTSGSEHTVTAFAEQMPELGAPVPMLSTYVPASAQPPVGNIKRVVYADLCDTAVEDVQTSPARNVQCAAEQKSHWKACVHRANENLVSASVHMTPAQVTKPACTHWKSLMHDSELLL